MAHAIRTIRTQIRRVADVGAGTDDTYLILVTTDSAREVITSRIRTESRAVGLRDVPRQLPGAVTGLPPVDSLNRVLGVDSVEIQTLSESSPERFRIAQLRLHFVRTPNVPVLAAMYARLPDVSYAGPDLWVGDGDWATHFRRSDGWYFVFSKGWGDCPAGCTERNYVYIMYDPDRGRARQVAVLETGEATPSALRLWDIPTSYSADIYESWGDLRNAMEDDRWWARLHAVRVLGYILRPPGEPWRGAAEQSREHFATLEASILARRQDAMLWLARRIGDDDEAVRRNALASLRRVTGVDLGEGAAAVATWERFIREMSRDAAPRP